MGQTAQDVQQNQDLDMIGNMLGDLKVSGRVSRASESGRASWWSEVCEQPAERAERVRSGVSMVRESAQTGNGDQMDAVVSGVGSGRDGRNGTGGRGCRKVTISLQSCLALLQASSAASSVHLYHMPS